MSFADELASCWHLAAMLGEDAAVDIAWNLGLPTRDIKWVTPAGVDLTGLGDMSLTGGFSSSGWKLTGWVLDQRSLNAVTNEFPEYLHLITPFRVE